MCVFMSPGRLSWLHKIELVISNISSPKGGGRGAEVGVGWGAVGEVGSSCRQGTSRVFKIQRDARGRDVNVSQNQIDGCPNPQRARPEARSTRQNQIKPTRYRRLCSLVVSADEFSA